MNCEEKRPLLIHTVISAIQVCLVIALFVFAARGKGFLDDSESGSGIPYYIGAFIVASVYGCLTISTLLLIAFYAFDVRKGHGTILCSICVFACLGIPSFIIGVIFTALFGLSNCEKNEDTTYDLNGMCSYDSNIDSNYNTAVVCLVLIISLFVTNIITIFLLCKYDGEMEDEDIIIQQHRAAVKASKKNGRNRTLRMMVRDRKVRQDEQKQRRMGVPEHKITKKFIPKY